MISKGRLADIQIAATTECGDGNMRSMLSELLAERTQILDELHILSQRLMRMEGKATSTSGRDDRCCDKYIDEKTSHPCSRCGAHHKGKLCYCTRCTGTHEWGKCTAPQEYVDAIHAPDFWDDKHISGGV